VRRETLHRARRLLAALAAAERDRTVQGIAWLARDAATAPSRDASGGRQWFSRQGTDRRFVRRFAAFARARAAAGEQEMADLMRGLTGLAFRLRKPTGG
jgi:hypothetical protein